MRLVRLAVALLLTCSSAACSGPAKSPQPLCAATPGFTCTTLRVPLNHRKPSGAQLKLAVAAADNVNAPRGVLLVLTGGPGQPGVSLLARVRNYMDPVVLQEYRLVMFDQRGTGSTGIDCPELQTAVGGSDSLTPPIEAVQACASKLGSARNFYGTPDTVEDIELLRQSLKQERLTLDGTSYGSFTAAQYGLKYPNHVRSLVLDSVVPHGGIDPFGVDLMAATGKVLKATCRHDPACTTDPVTDLAWLVRHGEVDGSPLNGTSLIEAFSILSLNSVDPSFEGIPKVLDDARKGDTAALKELFQQATSRGLDYAELSAGLHLVTLCSDLRFPWGTSATPAKDRAAALDSAVRALDPARLYSVRHPDGAEPVDGRGVSAAAADAGFDVPGRAGVAAAHADSAGQQRLVLPAGVGRVGEGSRSPGTAGRSTGKRARRTEQPGGLHRTGRGQGILAGLRRLR
jgi:pimeloyl-ACP methyl ester carboxylesterase